MTIRKVLLLTVAAAAFGLEAIPAQAQTEEIIVTARKRQESILKVPVVESVISTESINKYNVVSFTEISQRVPGLVIGASTGIIGNNVAIRGIGTSGTNPIIDQDVLLSIDGMPLTHGLAYNAGTFDLGQVEVLKGPQALFFGKNSPAGVISLRSADPTDKTEIVMRAGYEFEAKEKVGEIIASGPVTSTLKMRLAARFSHMDGWMKNLGVGVPALGGQTPTFTNSAPDRNWVVRGTVLFDPSDVYSARAKVTWAERKMRGGGDLQIANCPDGTAGIGGRPVLINEDCILDNVLRSAWANPAAFPGIPNGGQPFQNLDQGFGTLEQNLKVRDDLTVTSVTAYYTAVTDSMFNGSASNSFPALMAHNYLVNQQFTQELRLTSDFSGPFNFMFGGFYQDQVLKSHPDLKANTFVGLPASIGNTRHVIPIKSTSVFGQVLYKIVSELELAVGGRWTHEKRTHREFNFLASNGPVGGEIPRFDGRIEPSNFSPEISLTYTPTDDFTIFGNYKQGFKSGSFNAVSFVSATTAAAFNDEKVEGGEIGIKTRMLDRRLSLNVAGYYTKYSGIQVGASERSSTGAVLSKTINAEGAKIYGLEIDAVYTPESVEGLTLSGAVNYNHARYGRFANAPCGGGQTIAEGCNQLLNTTVTPNRFTAQDLSGRPLSRAPMWTGNVGFDYEHPVFNDMTLAVGSALNFSSNYYTNILSFDTPGYKQNSFAKLNMNLALRGPNNAWEVAVIGTNITNKYTAGYCFNSNVQGVSFFGGVQSGLATKGPAGDEEPDCIVDRGRSVMLRVTVRPLDFLKN